MLYSSAMWLAITGILIATLTALVSSAKEIRRAKSSSGSTRAWLRRNRFALVQIVLATAAMAVAVIGLVTDQREHALEARKSRLMQFSLAHLQSKPKFYFYFKSKNVAQSWARYSDEKNLEEEQERHLLPGKFVFVPSAVRDVIFPFADNAQAFPSQEVGEVDFFLGEDVNQISFYSSGLTRQLGRRLGLLSERDTGGIIAFNDNDTAVAVTLQLVTEWPLGTVYQKILQSSNEDGNPLLRITRWRTNCPPAAPIFKEARLTTTLSSDSSFKITVPLKVSKFTCDSAHSNYTYYFRPAEDPDIIDAASDPLFIHDDRTNEKH